MSDSVRPQRRQPTRLPRPWDSPGKNTGVGCHFLLLAHFLIESFIFLELSCWSCLHIFEISPLSVASFAIIFSHSEDYLFTLLIVSFVMQKLLILIRSHLFIFLLFPVFWEVSHRGSCCDVCRRVFCLCSLRVL